MEGKVIVKEILQALNEYSRQINEKMDKGFAEVDEQFKQVHHRFEKVDEQFKQVNHHLEEFDKQFTQVNLKIDRLTDDVKRNHLDIRATQATSDFAAEKVLQHEKEIRKLKAQ